MEPTPGLLMSMAIRHDHGLGVPGYYDNLRDMWIRPGKVADMMPTHAQVLESTLRQMRQLWEEVAGQGFYSPDKEAEYVAILEASRRPISPQDGDASTPREG